MHKLDVMKKNSWWYFLSEVIKLGRLPFLGAGLILYATGAVLAAIGRGYLPPDQFIMGYAIVMPAHLSVSYSNDYYDFELDNPEAATAYTGGSGVLQRHPELRGFAWKFAVLLISVSLTLAVIYTLVYRNPAVLLLAVAGNLLGWFYSAPPARLSYRGFGEVATALTGFIFPAMGYSVIRGVIDTPLILFSIPIMLLQLVFIINVEIPDLREDLLGGEMTFPVRMGVRASRSVMALSAAAATVALGLLEFSPHFDARISFPIIALLSLTVTVPCIYYYLHNPDEVNVRGCEVVMNSLIAFGVLDLLYLISVLVMQ